MPVKLSAAALAQLSDDISVPKYDRSSLSAGILHIGVGNFHRAHEAVYLDRLFSLGFDHDWGIVGSGLKPADETMRADLETQDWLSTVVELDPQGLKARVCAPMIDYLEVDPARLVDRLTAPDIRIVSMTVTEGGYYVDATSGGLQLDDPEIVHDISNPDAPSTVFGCLLAALARRREAGVPPFTIMSCDNLPGNGHITQATTVGLAEAISPEFGDWVSAHVSFPNSMVDCITPATSDRERLLVTEQFGIIDQRPVVCEPFRQWVMEDDFSNGRPALEKVGVQFVKDVAPYELMKLRILNGGHAAIGYAAGLLGIEFVHEAMAHRHIRGFLEKLTTEEVIPTVPPIPGVAFDAYFASVVERFSNSAVADTVARLCLDGSNRQPKFVLPVIHDRLDAGASIEGLALEVALWCRYCTAEDEAGRPIMVDDVNAAELKALALEARGNPVSFLQNAPIFGALGERPAFANAFSSHLQFLWANGTVAALQNYCEA